MVESGRQQHQKWLRRAGYALGGAVIASVLAYACALWVPLSLRGYSTRIPLPGGQAWGKLENMTIEAPVQSDGAERMNELVNWFDQDWVRARGFVNGLTVRDGLSQGLRTERGFGVERERFGTNFRDVPSDLTSGMIWVVRAGWPVKCFEGGLWREFTGSAGNFTTSRKMIHATAAPDWLKGRPLPGTNEVVLPHGVLWLGFIANTAVFAVSLWLAGCGVRRVVANVRHRRGTCAGCGYSRAGLTPETRCPECGAMPLIDHTQGHRSEE